MKNVELEQGSLAWKQFRKEHIGSSDIAAIMGVSPYKTAYHLWLEKTGRKEEDASNYFMLMGKAKEEDARPLYSDITGNLIIPSIKLYDEWEIAMASLDGISIDGDIICEIKCPSDKKYESYFDEGIPEHIEAQIQWQLMITSAKKCDYFVYLDHDTYHLEEVFPDPGYQKHMLEEASDFWDCVQMDTPPEMTEKDFLHIEDAESNALAAEEREIDEKIKVLKKKQVKIRDRLLNRSDDGNCIFSHAGVKITRINRKGNVDWPKVCDHWNISNEDLEEFRKPGIGYPNFSYIKLSPKSLG